MLLTLSTSHRPATDLGYLLAKRPGRCQSFDLAFGQAHVFYPRADEERCTAALLLDVDPVGLVRGRGFRGARGGASGGAGSLDQYVNDRPYVASSFLAVAIARVLGSALGGRSRERPELAETAISLAATLVPLPARGGGEALLRRLFEPLGYEVEATLLPLAPAFPEWGDSAYFRLGLRATVRLQDLLSHLYVLVPVLDHDKHYWVGDAEVDKLLAHGNGWLAGHPQREEITRRYLHRQPRLARQAMAVLQQEDGVDPDEPDGAGEREEEALERPIGLDELRRRAVVAVLHEIGAQSVADLGCGEGKLLRVLLDDRQFTDILGMDVSPLALERAERRLDLDRMPEAKRRRLRLVQGSLTYRDRRLAGFDAACLVEVVEHLDPPRLAQLERVVFEHAAPATVVVTTPNGEYNRLFPNLPAGHFRHPDHRFEWTRAELAAWAEGVAARHGYRVRFAPVGEVHPEHGPATQMAVFERPGGQA